MQPMTDRADPTPMPEDERRDRPLHRFRQLLRSGRAPRSPEQCAHLQAARQDIAVPDAPTCADHTPDDGQVVHLRICLTCAHVACCDSSRPQHATAHHRATGHPVMRSAESGEMWRWCYLDELVG